MQLQELEAGLHGNIHQVGSSVTGYLRHDDYYLQKWAATSVLDADDGQEMQGRVTRLTAKLSDLTREEIECRLDRLYLQQIAKQGLDKDHEEDELQDHELALEQDLKSLHIEIPDLAALSVAQDFKAPLLRALARQQTRKNDQAQIVLEDVCGPVKYDHE